MGFWFREMRITLVSDVKLVSKSIVTQFILALVFFWRKREAKSKGEKERYTHLNPEFQRMARRDKKAFLSDQCKEIEENIRMGKTRDIFTKIRDIKRTFHAKMGTRKVRNGTDLTETEDIKKMWQEYTEDYTKKICQIHHTPCLAKGIS